jgi:hypothetical protein
VQKDAKGKAVSERPNNGKWFAKQHVWQATPKAILHVGIIIVRLGYERGGNNFTGGAGKAATGGFDVKKENVE